MKQIEWKTEKRKLSDLIPYDINPRKLSDKQHDQLKRSLEKFNLAEIPAITLENTLLAGHQRCRVLAELKGSDYEIDVRVPNRKLSKAEEKEYLVRSNKNSGEWDYDLLTDNFKMDDLLEWGFEDIDFPEIEELEPEETAGDDDVPEHVEPKTVKGDVYILGGKHKIMCGDSTLIDDVEKLMGGEKADMVFTDPPYGVDYVGGVIHGNKINKDHKREKLKNDNVDIYSDFIKIIPSIIQNGAIYIFYATRNSFDLFKPLNDSSIDIMAVIAWIKINTGYSDMNSHYKNRYEPCVYCKVGSGTNFIGETNENTTWEIEKDRNNKLHPTQKPVSVPERAIKNHNAEKVADLFLGSGSTLIASEKTNRTCYGMELDEKYCDIIVNRYVDFCKKNNREWSVQLNEDDITGEYNGL